MLLSALSFLVVEQSSSEVPEGLMNNPVLLGDTCKQRFSLRPHQFHAETKVNNGMTYYVKAHDNNRILTVLMQRNLVSTTLKRVRFQGTYRKRNFYLLKSYLHRDKNKHGE